jgi:hypothetical protein
VVKMTRKCDRTERDPSCVRILIPFVSAYLIVPLGVFPLSYLLLSHLEIYCSLSSLFRFFIFFYLFFGFITPCSISIFVVSKNQMIPTL